MTLIVEKTMALLLWLNLGITLSIILKNQVNFFKKILHFCLVFKVIHMLAENIQHENNAPFVGRADTKHDSLQILACNLQNISRFTQFLNLIQSLNNITHNNHIVILVEQVLEHRDDLLSLDKLRRDFKYFRHTHNCSFTDIRILVFKPFF
jgi:hypothetical protein